MPLDETYVSYLNSQSKGRLATIAPDGTPQNKPVGFSYNAELGTIDIGGFNNATSAKYKNIASHPAVSFVVDDAVGEGAAGMRFLEIRGAAEQVGEPDNLIRIHPRRVVSWNLGGGEASFSSQDLAG
ncbi:MAG TPA: PPOX class F420-dependent oxidoreductase [Acidimicrobiales bacterium]|jgi:pyridoxamine 5'-phosphate oxidase family protein